MTDSFRAGTRALFFSAQRHHLQKLNGVLDALSSEGVEVIYLTSQNGNDEFSGDFELPLLESGIEYHNIQSFLEPEILRKIRHDVLRINQDLELNDSTLTRSAYYYFSDMAVHYAISDLVENLHLLRLSIERFTPSFCLSLYEGNFWAKLLAMECNSRSIPFFSFQEGLYSPLELMEAPYDWRGILTKFSSKVFLWGREIGDLFSAQEGVREKVEVVGAPHTDSLLFRKETFKRDVFLEEVGLSSKQKTAVLFLSAVSQNIEPLIAKFFDSVKGSGWQGIVKFRPATDYTLFEALASRYSRTSFRLLFNDDPYSLMFASDLVFCGYTTVGSEALLLGKPLCFIRDGDADKDYFGYEEVALAVVNTGDTSNCSFPTLDDVLLRDNEDYRVKVDLYLKDRFYKLDGQTASRVVASIKSYMHYRPT